VYFFVSIPYVLFLFRVSVEIARGTRRDRSGDRGSSRRYSYADFRKTTFFIYGIKVRKTLFARKVLGYRYRFAVADFPFSALNEHNFLCFYYGARPRRPF
jgi:hypothetical protein